MKSKISNRNLFKGGNIVDMFTSLNVKEEDITNSYISNIDLKSDRFMFNQSYINTYYLHLAIFCYYYENSKADRAEYITAKVNTIKEYVRYYVLYQILNKIMNDNDNEGKYLNAIISIDDFDATPITFNENEKEFVKIKNILNATAFIIKYVKLTSEIKTKLRDYVYTREKIDSLNDLIEEANKNKSTTGIPKQPPAGQDKELEKIKKELNNFDLKDVSSFKIFQVITKAVDFIKKINDDTTGADKVQLIVSGGADITDLQQAYDDLLDDDKAKLKEIGDILSGTITRDAAKEFYNRFNDEYIKREFLLKFQFDAFNNQVTGGAMGEIDDRYLEIVESRFGTIKNATGIYIYDDYDIKTNFNLKDEEAKKDLANLLIKIDINNYIDKTDIIYKIYEFYQSYIKICNFIRTKNQDFDELNRTATTALTFIGYIRKYIQDHNLRVDEDISIIADKFIADTILELKNKISPTTTDDFLKKIDAITQDNFDTEKGKLLSETLQEPPSGDKLKIYDFLVKLNKDDSKITKADINVIQNNDVFRLNAYKYLLMKSMIDKGEDVSSIIAEKDVDTIIKQLESLQTGGGATDKPNNIFNAYTIMVMNKIMEMDKIILDNFNKNLKTIEA